MDRKRECTICSRNDGDEVMFGDWLTKEDVTVHYFCLLSGTYIPQRGTGKTELMGFLAKDVKASQYKYADKSCYICKGKSAAIKCAQADCDRTWHFPCGSRKACLTVFSGAFESYCDEHVPDPNGGKKHIGNVSCLICFCFLDSSCSTEVHYNHVDSILSSCCAKKHDWNKCFMHRDCVMKYTKNAGYDSMCPTCPMDKEPGTLKEKKLRWQAEMRTKGIFIPLADATWEQDEYFKKQVKNKCGKPQCHYQSNNVWTCYVCGCFPLHLKCAKVAKPEDYFCPKCYDQSFVERVPRY